MTSALTQAFQSELKRTRVATADASREVWRHLGSYNRADIKTFVDRVHPIVLAGQSRAVGLTSAYMARQAQTPIQPVPLQDVVKQVRHGADPYDVYRRSFIGVWKDLERGENWDVAVSKGGNRIWSTTGMDVLLAFTAGALVYGAAVNAAAQSSGADTELIGYRRVADPSCCDFCTNIDGAFCGPSEPMPLHNNCGCTIDPIMGRPKEAASLASEDGNLAPGEDIGDTAIEEHGELGPLITRKGDFFTGPEDI
jgi:hypothetical protein